MREVKSPALVDRIVDQKYALDDLISLVESYNTKNDLDNILGDLNTLKGLFAKSKVVKVDSPKNTDGKVVLGGDEKLTMAAGDMMTLVKKLKEIRGRYTSA